MKIDDVRAIEVLDSRGYPTVRAFIKLENGIEVSSSVPSGASTGTHEALELRDNDKKRYHGKGVLKAVNNVNSVIGPAIINKGIEDLYALDKTMLELDGTKNKSRLGANAILSVSMGLVRALSVLKNKPLWQTISEYYFPDRQPKFPRIMVNVVNGGKHAGWNFDIQEFMVVPTSTEPKKAIRVASEIFHQLGTTLKEKKLSTLVGDEGGYSPSLSSNEEVLSAIESSASVLSYKNGQDFHLAIDAAATEFYQSGKYVFKKTNQQFGNRQLVEYYLSLQIKHQILSFEDPFAEDDWEGFTMLTAAVGGGGQVVGDDLYVTDPSRIQQGIDKKASSAVLIKPNQIGSMKETVEAIKLTQQSGQKVVVSHRSGETEDSFIADLAYGAGVDFIKTGSMSRSERLCKYNRLLEIDDQRS